MPRAPVISVSISGLRSARSAASLARFSPRRVADAHQRGAGVRHDRAHVGEVEVDQARVRDQVADALDAVAQDVVGDAERVEHRGRLVEHLEQAVVRDDDQRVAGLAQRSEAVVGLLARGAMPSNLNGIVTMPTVSAPSSRAIRATTGAAPEPVPPPSPAVTKTMSEPRSARLIAS